MTITHLLAAGLGALVMGCTSKAPAADASPSRTVQHQATPPVTAQAESAHAFAQRFYDWYLATETGNGSPYDSLLTSHRGWLSDTLFRALQADIADQRADTVTEIASLSAEADVFLNSQDPCSHYAARAPRAIDAERFAIVVAGDCLEASPNIELYMRLRGASWQIENIKDPTDPSFDLLSALARYRAEMSAPSKSLPVGAHAKSAIRRSGAILMSLR